MKTTLALFAAAGLALSATTAQADEVSVSYQDLDLASAAGQQALDKRIDRAARTVCAHKLEGKRTVRQERETRSCFAKAKARAGDQYASATDATAMGG